jgi:hypothetical protein
MKINQDNKKKKESDQQNQYYQGQQESMGFKNSNKEKNKIFKNIGNIESMENMGIARDTKSIKNTKNSDSTKSLGYYFTQVIFLASALTLFGCQISVSVGEEVLDSLPGITNPGVTQPTNPGNPSDPSSPGVTQPNQPSLPSEGIALLEVEVENLNSRQWIVTSSGATVGVNQSILSDFVELSNGVSIDISVDVGS